MGTIAVVASLTPVVPIFVYPLPTLSVDTLTAIAIASVAPHFREKHRVGIRVARDGEIATVVRRGDAVELYGVRLVAEEEGPLDGPLTVDFEEFCVVFVGVVPAGVLRLKAEEISVVVVTLRLPVLSVRTWL